MSLAATGDVIFLSTEDNITVKNFEYWSIERCPVFYTNVSRYHHVQSPMAHAKEIGPDNEVLNSLVSLYISLACRAFVVPMVSNWGRLIDELRSTVACKAHTPLVDPAQHAGIKDLNW